MSSENKENSDSNSKKKFFLKRKSRFKTVHPGIHVNGAMGNLVSIETDLGIVQVDTGNSNHMAKTILNSLRKISDAPIHTIIYSHGHNSYNFGVEAFIKAAEERGEPRPQIVAHERLPLRYRRYQERHAVRSVDQIMSRCRSSRSPGRRWFQPPRRRCR